MKMFDYSVPDAMCRCGTLVLGLKYSASAACLVAESINGLFLRNSVNFGFPALECRGIEAAFEEGDVAEVSFDDYMVRNQRTGAALTAEPLPEALKRLMEAGGLFRPLESEGYLAPKDAPVKGT